MTDVSVARHGPQLLPQGGVAFRLWAPACAQVTLDAEGPGAGRHLMTRDATGWHDVTVAEAGPGTRYRFILPDGLAVPDPASRFQPEDVHGPSEVIDPRAYAWQSGWRGRPWSEAVVYELHVGSFTPEGTFRAAIGKLDHLAGLGVTAIEIMPVSDFPGGRNWGYDGVLPFAPDSSYGRPDDLKALVDAAHARGIMVLLDVVYNHFGPDGNYLPVYAPQFFTERHKTPWGAAVNFDGEGSEAVRRFVLENVRAWITEFRLDGLRFDAVHAIIDDGPRHILEEIAATAHGCVDRPVHLVLENEDNTPARLVRDGFGTPRQFTAQWNDDVHHVLHVAATGESAGYYADYTGKPELLGRALAEGFAYQGQTMPYSGKRRGAPSAALPPAAFVAFIQNHDQIGNRAFGDRLNLTATPEAMRALSAVYLLLPQAPMIFMGEEFGARTPFPFFCDFEGELADAVRKGRREEFARFPEFEDPKQREKIPDPLADTTFASAKLDWSAQDPVVVARYRKLLELRRTRILPLLPHITRGGSATAFGDNAVQVRWDAGRASANRPTTLVLSANLSSTRVEFPPAEGQVFHHEGDIVPPLGPWAVRWSILTA